MAFAFVTHLLKIIFKWPMLSAFIAPIKVSSQKSHLFTVVDKNRSYNKTCFYFFSLSYYGTAEVFETLCN